MEISKNSDFSNWMDKFVKAQTKSYEVGDIVEVIDEKSPYYNDSGEIQNIEEKDGQIFYLINLYRSGQVWTLGNQIIPVRYNFKKL